MRVLCVVGLAAVLLVPSRSQACTGTKDCGAEALGRIFELLPGLHPGPPESPTPHVHPFKIPRQGPRYAPLRNVDLSVKSATPEPQNVESLGPIRTAKSN